jgi:hypothetical protein
MKQQQLFDSESIVDEWESDESGDEFEFDQEEEFEQDWDVQFGPQKPCCKCCRKRLQKRRRSDADEVDEAELSRFIPSWVDIAKKLYDAGRLGWRAGRWLDKQSGKIFGKKISKKGAEFLYKHFGRSRRLEDFVDSLPWPILNWLYSL